MKMLLTYEVYFYYSDKLQKYNYVDNDRFKILNKDEISEFMFNIRSLKSQIENAQKLQ